jgi:hypothetical protein
LIDADADASVVAFLPPGFSWRFANRMILETVGEIGSGGKGERADEPESCDDCETWSSW